MGEVQEQRYICRICSKTCVSGKSLGGHMRVHLAQISSSKKEKSGLKSECDDQEEDDQEKMADFMDAEQSNSYELRENPKKSWRISDPKHGLIKIPNSCKECGKEFASLRALSGHMRCHSIKNKIKKELHCCKECGRGFDSLRAMFGHMKSHSKRLKMSRVESGESLSDLENFCPIRRKRSRIRYKGTVNPLFSSFDASDSVFSELEQAEEAAKCLVLLSKGVCLDLDSVTESSDDDSAYFGGVGSCGRSKIFCGVDGDFVVKMDSCSSSYANAVGGMNVSGFDELDLKPNVEFGDDLKSFVATKCEELDQDLLVGKSDLEKNSSENQEMVDDSEKGPSQCGKIGPKMESSRSNLCVNGDHLDQDLLVGESDLGKNSSENQEMVDHSEKRPSQCGVIRPKMESNLCVNDDHLDQESKVCHKSIPSECGIIRPKMQPNLCVNDDPSLEPSKIKEHECPICFKVFPSGQALGGHKRAHYNGVAESKNRDVSEDERVLDLNFPIAVDAGSRARLGLSSWFVDRSREHEAFVLTT